MNVYKTDDIFELVRANAYPGRGIVIGKSKCGRYAVSAYFIMGRSKNSRNRIFTERNGDIYTEPYDAALVEDPSLIIYAAVRSLGNKLIVTNGDQTDTVYEGLRAGKGFGESLESRCFEPDAPNFTPRISGMLTFENRDFAYDMSILKSGDALGTVCQRYTYRYSPVKGVGHFIHTYMHDGDPLPTFVGEPHRVEMLSDIDEFTDKLWENLNEENKISLYVRYTDLETGEFDSRLVNKNK